jgi:hypothetical protein
MALDKVFDQFKSDIEESVKHHRNLIGNMNSLTDTAHRYGWVEGVQTAFNHLTRLMNSAQPAPTDAPQPQIIGPVEEVEAERVV